MYENKYDELGHPIWVFSDGLVVTVGNDSVNSVIVDFQKISSKYEYNYRGIDENSAKEDVIKILGEPENLRFTSDNYKRYPIDDYEFEIMYSDDGRVIWFEFERN